MNTDIDIIIWVQKLFGLESEPFFGFFTGIGTGEITVLVIALVFWLGGTTIGYRALILNTLGGYVNSFIKTLTVQPRPYYITDRYQALIGSSGLGMPSGHAQRAATVWGSIAYSAKHYAVAILAGVFIFFTGLSRIYYGLHTPTQVLVGWLIGFIIVFVAVRIEQPFLKWFRGLNIWPQVGLVILVVGLLFGADYVIVNTMEASFEVPTEWSERFEIVEGAEAAREGKEPDEFKLFEKPSIADVGMPLSVGLCGLYFLHYSTFEITSNRQRIANILMGIVVSLCYWVPFYAIEILGDGTFAELILDFLSPVLITIVVPLLAERVIRLLPERAKKAASEI